jgi:hypothetical protein
MADSPRDQRHYEPKSVEELMEAFPNWQVWKGVNGMFFARWVRVSPTVLVRAEDLSGIHEEMMIKIWTFRRNAGW